MLKRLGIVLVIVSVFVLVIWFTSLNRGTLHIDLAFTTVDPPVSLALSVCIVLGWLFGVACAGTYILKLLAERRSLRNELSNARSEVKSLRNLPMTDAD